MRTDVRREHDEVAAPRSPTRDAYEAAWLRLVGSEGIGPSRLRALLLLDPGCGDEGCFYYDAATGSCRLLDAGIPWSRGRCRMRTMTTRRD